MTVADPVERLLTGSGRPVTVFAHGLAGTIADTQPLGSAVAGTRMFFQFRGHGGSAAPPGPWRLDDLVGELARVSDESGASRALGVSLGAGVLCRLLSKDPGRYDRLVFYLPAALDTPPRPQSRERFAALVAAQATGSKDRLLPLLAEDIPPALAHSSAAVAYLRQRVSALLAQPLAPQLADVLDEPPCPDPAVLAAVTAPALVIAARDDQRHPVTVAEQLAAALGSATLHVYDQPAPLWTARADLRTRISTFLNTSTPGASG